MTNTQSQINFTRSFQHFLPVQGGRPQYLKDWRQTVKEWESVSSSDWEGPECLALQERWMRLGELLCQTQANTIEGVTAQFEYLNEDLGEYITESVSSKSTVILDIIQSGLKELAKGAS